MKRAGRLREMLEDGRLIRAPGAYDVWSAKLIEKAGFEAVYMSGYGVSASVLGKPDIGPITFSEIADMAENMAAAIDIPLIVDCDTGFGTELNVIRCVNTMEKAGAAAIQLEDQTMPKRCGHMEGKTLISEKEMVSKIRAAVYARQDKDFIIIARTDARATEGIEAAIKRSRAYVRAGADAIFLEAPQNLDEIKKAAQSIEAYLVSNMVENGKTPLQTTRSLERMGYNIVLYPVTTLYTATKAIRENLETLGNSGDLKACMNNCVDFQEFNDLIELRKERALEKKFMEG